MGDFPSKSQPANGPKFPFPLTPMVHRADLPLGGDYEDMIEHLGDPAPYLQGDGQPSAAWPSLILSPVPVLFPSPVRLHAWPKGAVATKVFPHRRIVDLLVNTLEDLKTKALWHYITDYSGCYAFRAQRGSEQDEHPRLSTHSWGIALDFNASTYPLRAEPNPHDPFIQYVVPAFQKRGWTWGGEWARKDCMHFQATQGA